MKLFIGNLGDDGLITSEDLKTRFESFGEVSECEVVKRYAFVHMTNEKEGLEALSNLNGISIKGRRIKVEKGEIRGPVKKPSTKLFIGNLAEGTDKTDLENVFSSHVSVIEADVIKNYGFIHIDADASKAQVMELVRELNGFELKGNKIRVQLSTSGVRKKPGMNGDTCYRCGREGHWSKACPIYPNDSEGRHYGRQHSYGIRDGGHRSGMDRNSNRHMRSAFHESGRQNNPYNNTTNNNNTTSNHYHHHRGGGEPYPPPIPPSYIRERSYDYDYHVPPRNNYSNLSFREIGDRVHEDSYESSHYYHEDERRFNYDLRHNGLPPPQGNLYRAPYFSHSSSGYGGIGNYGVPSTSTGGYGSVISTATGHLSDPYTNKGSHQSRSGTTYSGNYSHPPNSYGYYSA